MQCEYESTQHFSLGEPLVRCVSGHTMAKYCGCVRKLFCRHGYLPNLVAFIAAVALCVAGYCYITRYMVQDKITAVTPYVLDVTSEAASNDLSVVLDWDDILPWDDILIMNAVEYKRFKKNGCQK